MDSCVFEGVMGIRRFNGKEFIEATVCVVENNNQEFLMIKHKRGPFLGLKNCPGGKKDKNESLIEASIRETESETGITPINPRVVGSAYFENKDAPNFWVEFHKTEEYEGEVVGENDECFSFWQDKKNLPKHEMHNPDTPIFDMILKGQIFNVYSKHGKVTNLADVDIYENNKQVTNDMKKNPHSASIVMACRASREM